MNTKIAKKYLKLLAFKIVRGFDAHAPIPELGYFEKPVHEEINLSEGHVLKYLEDVRLIDDEKYYQVLFNPSDKKYLSDEKYIPSNIYLSEKTLNDKDLFRDPVKTCFQVKLFDTLEDLNLFLEENCLKSDCDVQITTNNKFLLKYLRVGDE